MNYFRSHSILYGASDRRTTFSGLGRSTRGRYPTHQSCSIDEGRSFKLLLEDLVGLNVIVCAIIIFRLSLLPTINLNSRFLLLLLLLDYVSYCAANISELMHSLIYLSLMFIQI
jgi:hypothetical protein